MSHTAVSLIYLQGHANAAGAKDPSFAVIFILQRMVFDLLGLYVMFVLRLILPLCTTTVLQTMVARLISVLL